MSKVNLKGVDAKSVTGVLVFAVALINAVLQMFGLNVLPITNDELSAIVSSIFVIGSGIFAVYKNFNISTASQTAQRITDAIKQGELLIDDIEALLDKIKK